MVAKKRAQKGGQVKEEVHAEARDNALEIAIGEQTRAFRRQLKLTVSEVARSAGLSPGMLSKIENGNTSPSLATLKALSRALNVPVTAFFRKYEEQRDCTYVPAGEGLLIERRGTRAGHQYQLLGHTVGKPLSVEPYLAPLTSDSDVFPLFQDDGVEFIYLCGGAARSRGPLEAGCRVVGHARGPAVGRVAAPGGAGKCGSSRASSRAGSRPTGHRIASRHWSRVNRVRPIR